MLKRLTAYLSGLKSTLLCYSGGTDSALLLKVCSMIPELRAEAVFFDSAAVPRADAAHALQLAEHIGLPLTILHEDILAVDTIRFNPENRCYLCKRHMLHRATELASQKGISSVIEGSHADDLKELRPGRQAIQELGILSPFEAVGMGKSDIRHLSRALGLDTWDRPSFSCLMTRLPHGMELSTELLARMDAAEQYLRDAGMRNFRVRHKGAALAVLELGADEEKIYNSKIEQLREFFADLGYNDLRIAHRS